MLTTAEELAKLDEARVEPDHLIWTEYFFSHFHSQKSQRQAFREALRAGGFTGIGSDEEISGNGYWHHWSHTVRQADPESLRAADAAAAAIADAHGVRYGGWAIVYELTGSLRSASVKDAARLRADDERSFRMARQL